MSVRTSPGEVLNAIKDSHEEMTARSNDIAAAPAPKAGSVADAAE
jgi:hypothetical protein